MKHLLTAAATAILSLSVYACAPAQSAEKTEIPASAEVLSAISGPQAPFKNTRTDGLEEMIIAGGCFWCTESDFEKITGVKEAVSGYTGGTLDNPTYKKVGTNRTGHYEAVKVTYDPAVVTYRQLVDHYWKTVDPTDDRGQFCDKGASYRSAIFVTPEQRVDAEKSLALITETKPFSDEIVTPILPAVTFYDAEAYHQNYYKRNSLRYKYYRNGCGRDKRLKQLWGDG
ncbi:MAG: peptide-methionine (S)-S-oxide reductase MsrA [Litorimonas sp.]